MLPVLSTAEELCREQHVPARSRWVLWLLAPVPQLPGAPVSVPKPWLCVAWAGRCHQPGEWPQVGLCWAGCSGRAPRPGHPCPRQDPQREMAACPRPCREHAACPQAAPCAGGAVPQPVPSQAALALAAARGRGALCAPSPPRGPGRGPCPPLCWGGSQTAPAPHPCCQVCPRARPCAEAGAPGLQVRRAGGSAPRPCLGSPALKVARAGSAGGSRAEQ